MTQRNRYLPPQAQGSDAAPGGDAPALAHGRHAGAAAPGDSEEFSVLTDLTLGLLHHRGPWARFLTRSPTGTQQRLTELLPPEAGTQLRLLVQGALDGAATVQRRVVACVRGNQTLLTVEAIRQPQGPALLMIVFRPARPSADGAFALPPTADSEAQAGRTMNAGKDLQTLLDDLASLNEALLDIRFENNALHETLDDTQGRLQRTSLEVERANTELANLLRSADSAIVFLDEQLRLRRYTRAALELMQLGGKYVGGPIAAVPSSLDDPTFEGDARAVLADLHPREAEIKAAGRRWFSRRIIPYSTLEGAVDGLVVTYSDVTSLKAASDQLTARGRQQAILATLVQRALDGMEVQGLMQLATAEISKTLDVPLASVLEHRPEEDSYFLRAGVGWQPGLVGDLVLSGEEAGMAAYALRTEGPVLMPRYGEETRFSQAPILAQHGVTCGVSVAIRGNQGPLGVLSAFSDTLHPFTRDELRFVQAVANVLAQVVERAKAARELMRKEYTLDQALRVAQLGVAVWEAPQVEAEWSDEFYAILGVPPGSVTPVGRTFLRYVPESERAALRAGWKRMVKDSIASGVEHRLIRADGSERIVYTYAAVVADTHGRPQRVICTVQDITERRRAEIDQAELASMVQAAPDAMVRSSAEGIVLSWNPAAERMLGYRKEEIIGQHYAMIMPEWRRGEFRDLAERLAADGVVRIAETQRLRKDGTVIDVALSIAPFRDANGRPNGYSTVLHDISELKRTALALQRSQLNLTHAQQVAHLGSWVWDRQNDELTWSDEVYRIYGLPVGSIEPSKRIPMEAVPAEQRRDFKLAFQHAVQTGEPFQFEHPMRLPDGTEKVLYHMAETFLAKPGEPMQVIGTVLDITDRKRIENELATLNQNLEAQVQRRTGYLTLLYDVVDIANRAESVADACRKLLKRLCAESGALAGRVMMPDGEQPDMLRVVETHTQSTMRVEQAFEAAFGKAVPMPRSGAADDAEGTRWVPDFADDPRCAPWARVASSALRRGMVLTVAHEGLPAVVIDLLGVAEQASDTALTAVLDQVVSHLLQLVRRKQAEQDLRNKEALLRTVFDSIPFPLYVKDLDGRYTMVNRGLAAFWNKPVEDLLGRTIGEHEQYTPEQLQLIRETDQQVFDTGKPVLLPHVVLPWGDGRDAILRMHKIPLWESSGKLVGLVGLTEDITEKVRAEQELRNNEALLRTVFDTIPFPMFVKDLEGRFTIVNKKLADLWERTPEQMTGVSLQEFWAYDDPRVRKVEVMEQRVMETGALQELPEFDAPRRDGKRLVMRLLRMPLRDAAGSIVGIVGVAENITRRLQAEEERRTSDERLQDFLDHASDIIQSADADGRLIYTNRAWHQVLGYSAEEAARLNMIDLVHPDKAAEFRETLAQLLRGEDVGEIRTTFVAKNGQQVVVSGTANCRIEDGRPILTRAIFRDVTAQVQAEQALRDSQQMLRSIIDTVPLWIWVKNHQDEFLLVNQAFADGVGMTPEEILGKTTGDLFVLDNLAIVHAIDKHVLRGKNTQRWSDANGVRGHIIPVTTLRGKSMVRNSIKLPLRDASGEIIGLVGVSEDITNRVQINNELRSQRELLSTIIDTLPHWIWVKDNEGRILVANRSMARDHGMTPQEMTGKTVEDLYPPKDVPNYWRTDRMVWQRNERVELDENVIILPDGTRTVRKTTKLPYRDARGNMRGLVGIAEDVSAKIEAERTLRLQAHIIEQIEDGVVAIDLDGHIINWNRGAEAVFGMPAEAMLGQPLAQLFDEAEREAALGQLTRPGRPAEQSLEAKFPMRGQARTFQARITSSPLRNDAGRLQGRILYVRDISHQADVAQQVESSRQLLQSVLDSVPHWIWVKDRDHRVVMINAAMAEEWGTTTDAAVGRHAREFYDPASAEALMAEDDMVFREGKRTDVAARRIRQQGGRQERTVRSIKLPLRNESGAVVGIVGVAVDISDLETAKQDLQASQQMLRTVFDSVPYWIWVKDRLHRIVMANQAQAEAWGLTPEEAVGRRAQELFDPALVTEAIAEDERLYVTGERIDVPARPVRFKGQPTRIMRATKLPLRGPDGSIQGLVAVGEDITQKKRAEDELKDSRQMLQVVFDTVPHWLWVKDVHGNYTMANRSFTEFLGVRTEKAIGERAARFFPPDVVARFDASDREVLATGKTVEVEDLEVTMTDGRELLLHSIKIPLLDGQGRVQGLVGIAEDVIELKRALQQRESYAQLLEQKNKELGEFASAASHDLQEPLRKMRAFSELLVREFGDQLAGGDGQVYLNHIHDAAERLQGMISGLLSLSRLNEQRTVSEPVALSEVLETVAADLSEALRDAEAALELDAAHVVLGDATQLYRLFNNLIANAVKYRGALPPRIWVLSRIARPEEHPLARGADAAAFVAIDVADNGQGFPENEAARIFGLFQRLDPAGAITGQGIGLAECRRIAERHGGAISAHGKPGEGAVFTVLLPEAGRSRQ